MHLYWGHVKRASCLYDVPDTLVDELSEALAVVVVLVLCVAALLHLALHLEQVTVLVEVRPVVQVQTLKFNFTLDIHNDSLLGS